VSERPSDKAASTRFDLRLFKPGFAQAQLPDTQGLAGMDEKSPRTVLIIDDDPLVRRTLADFLTGCGFQTATAQDGAEGLAQARSGQFQVVLVDLNLPRVDGLQVITALQAEQPQLPVIVVSGTGVLDDALAAMRQGAWDYLTKPIHDMNKVLVIVEQTLDKARLIAERDRYRHELEQLNRSLEVEVARQTEDLRRRNRELSALNRVSYAISNPLDLDNMLHRAINAAVAAIKADGGAVRLLNPATGQLVTAAACNLPEPFLTSSLAIPLGEGIIGQVAQSGHPRGVESFDHDPWLAPLAESAAFRSYLCVPLRTRDEILGTLGVIMEAEFDVSAHELELLANIGNQIGVAVERLRLSEQIRDQARQVQGIISTVPEGVVLLDAGLKVLTANPAARKYLRALADAEAGDTLTHLGGRPVAELLTVPPHGLWHEVKLDGPPRLVFEMVARPMEEEPDAGDSVLVIRDVTQERAFQERLQQQDRLAAVGQLAAGIAHDFNNIMAVIVLYSGLLSRTLDLSPKAHEQLKVISRQAKQATKLIQQILDFSRRSILERQPLDLVPPLKEIVKLLQRTLPENIQVSLEVAPGEYVVNADPTRMQQVFMNLAVNARDAMPTGGELCINLGRIQVQDSQDAPVQELEPGGWVRIIVRDSGTGIPPDLLSHVFEPFFTTKEPGKGSGLGLAQVYGIVTQHQGYIDVASTVGEGTAFTLYLPALPLTGVETPQAEQNAPVDGQQEMVLVVEDNRATRQALRDALEALNYRTLEAEDGREGLELFERYQNEIALVLTDLVMPQMGGQALIRELLKRDPAVKVVVITGHPLEEDVLHLRVKGLIDVVEKPVSLEQLAQVIKHRLNSDPHRPHRE